VIQTFGFATAELRMMSKEAVSDGLTPADPEEGVKPGTALDPPVIEPSDQSAILWLVVHAAARNSPGALADVSPMQRSTMGALARNPDRGQPSGQRRRVS